MYIVHVKNHHYFWLRWTNANRPHRCWSSPLQLLFLFSSSLSLASVAIAHLHFATTFTWSIDVELKFIARGYLSNTHHIHCHCQAERVIYVAYSWVIRIHWTPFSHIYVTLIVVLERHENKHKFVCATVFFL